MNIEKNEMGNGLPRKDLVSILTDYDHMVDLEETFDTDPEIIDDNLNQGMKISHKGRPLDGFQKLILKIKSPFLRRRNFD